MKLAGHRIVLTGASRGVGKEAVALFTREGAELIGVARDAGRLAALEHQFPTFRGIAGDVSDFSLGRRIHEAVEARWGALDVLVNNAAIQSYNGGFSDEPLDLLEQTLKTNVLGVHQLTASLLPLLLRGRSPRVVNVSSGAGKLEVLQREHDMPAYRLSKFTLNGLTLLYAGDLRGKVAVNALDPGWLKTDLGGPNAPGEARDGAQRLLEVLEKPFEITGGFFYGAEPISY